ncbi:site-specific integrase [Flavobacteriaceae bacterium S356]|uniref:Site-specific integrase n=1 Tax=Asprobacillus argus TaxID=3076534 RepID=A0ABU3LFS1_9FLAO|nr:site-specific integrase [Flavobacteriaceae bacterium S356]
MSLSGFIKLDTAKNKEREDGFPLKCYIRFKGKRKGFTFKGMLFKKEDWNFDTQLPKHGKRDILFVQKKRAILNDLIFQYSMGTRLTYDQVQATILGVELEEPKEDFPFYEFADKLIAELESIGRQGNANTYRNAINQFKVFQEQLMYSDIDYNFLTEFKNSRIIKGNKSNTIHNYIRTFKAIYNEGARRNNVENTKPFAGIFKGITVKKNRTKKKNLSKVGVKILESLKLDNLAEQRSVDIWLLQFYLGGASLIDVYYLKKDNIKNSRVYFRREKLGDQGYQFDVKIFDKAQIIIDKYTAAGDYLFPWRKDLKGYENFRRNMRSDLKKVQEDYNTLQIATGAATELLQVLPLGGNLTSVVARHTFSTIAKHLYIDPDLIKEIMGHESDGINNVYRDLYPEIDRDEAQLRIITV